MKILVLGNSDTAGMFAGASTWPRVAAELVYGQGVAVTEFNDVSFSAVGALGAAFAERKVRELEPDLVILPIGTWPYSVGFVWVQVRERFGVRAAKLYQRLERSFETRTGSGGGSPSPSKSTINRAGRRFARTLIGARPLTTQEELTENYRQILRAIARIEAVEVLLVDYPAETGPLAKKKLSTPARRTRFLADIREEAEAHHYRLLVADDAFAAHPEGSLITPDGFHLNEAGHRVLGDAAAAVIMEGAAARH
ncbi:MAG: SGNH/GDSL hydrolase family protein [Anaerolineaceae bacterium]